IMAGDRESGVMVMKMDQGLDTGPIAIAERVAIDPDMTAGGLDARLGVVRPPPVGRAPAAQGTGGAGSNPPGENSAPSTQQGGAIDPDMTAGELHDRLALLGAPLMGRALAQLETGVLDLKPQDETGVTYASKVDKGETRIDWSKPARDVHNHIRGLSPFPGAWFELPGHGRVRVLRSTRHAGSGAPGTVLDDALTVACGDGSVRLIEVQRAGGRPMRMDDFLRGTPVAPGLRLR